MSKGNTTKTTNGEEDFEFGKVRELDNGRIVSNVQNNSHENPAEHVYPVFFEIEYDDRPRVRVVGCGCPAAKYHDGECKHCQTAQESALLLSDVLWEALDIDVKPVRDTDGESGEEEGEPDAHAGEHGQQPVATDGGRDVTDADDLSTVVDRLRHGHNSALVVVHDEKAEHIGFWDKSNRDVAAMTLDYMQNQGFRLVHAGVRGCDETGADHGWAEFRRKSLRDVYGGESDE